MTSSAGKRYCIVATAHPVGGRYTGDWKLEDTDGRCVAAGKLEVAERDWATAVRRARAAGLRALAECRMSTGVDQEHDANQ